MDVRDKGESAALAPSCFFFLAALARAASLEDGKEEKQCRKKEKGERERGDKRSPVNPADRRRKRRRKEEEEEGKL